MPPEPFNKPPDFCELHPNHPSCENVPSLPIESNIGFAILILIGIYFAFKRLKNEKTN